MYSYENKVNEMILRGSSEPCRCSRKFKNISKKSFSSRWPEDLVKLKISNENMCKCRCLKSVVTPLMNLARYIDDILLDVEE